MSKLQIISTALVIKDFRNQDISLKKEENELWMTVAECGGLLEYKNPKQAINNILNQHKNEFTNDITRVLATRTSEGRPTKVREFNLEGFALICMFSEQPRAAEARRWAIKLMKEMWVHGKVDPQPSIQEICHRDLYLLQDMVNKDPQTAEWVYPRIQYRWDAYATIYAEPKIAITPLTNEWLLRLHEDWGWSKDAIMLFFPRELRTLMDWETAVRSAGLSRRNALPIPPRVALQVARDYRQFNMRVDAIVRKYLYYSRDAIQKHLRDHERSLVTTMADNHVYGVKRYDKKSYAEYRDTEQWHNKKNVMTAPNGPFDLCWDCLRPISLSTIHLHHMLYDRVGFELWTDFRPLCAVCHANRHPAANTAAASPDGVVTLSNTQIIRETEAAILCTVNGQNHWFPKSSINEQSEVKSGDDAGTLIVQPWIARKNGLA